MRLTVLYEDSAGAEAKSFGPHRVLLKCLEIINGKNWYELKDFVVAIPSKGDGSLKAKLRKDGKRLANNGLVFSVFDHDKIRNCYQLPYESCKVQVIQEIKKDLEFPLEVVFLIENVEDLLRCLCEILGDEFPDKKPNPNQRDSICNKFAYQMNENSLKELSVKMPSFRRLIDTVAKALPKA